MVHNKLKTINKLVKIFLQCFVSSSIFCMNFRFINFLHFYYSANCIWVSFLVFSISIKYSSSSKRLHFSKQVIWDIIYVSLSRPLKRWGESNRRIKEKFVKNKLRLNFRQFCPINKCSLSHLCRRKFVYFLLFLHPLFEEPRRDRILPLCRAASRGLFEHTEIAIFLT